MDIRPSTDQATGTTGVWLNRQDDTERLAIRLDHIDGHGPVDTDDLFISMDRHNWVRLVNAVVDVLQLSDSPSEVTQLRSIPSALPPLDETTETWHEVPGMLMSTPPMIEWGQAMELLREEGSRWAVHTEDLVRILTSQAPASDDEYRSVPRAPHPFADWTRQDVERAAAERDRHAAATQSRIWEHEQQAHQAPVCTGDHHCQASVHVHGCYADTTDATCDAPWEHDDRPVGPVTDELADARLERDQDQAIDLTEDRDADAPAPTTPPD